MKKSITAAQFLSLFCLWLEIHEASRIRFGVIKDSNGYGEKVTSVIDVVMNYVVTHIYEEVTFTVDRIDPYLPLGQQMEDVCWSNSDIDILFSVTSCDMLLNLAEQSAALGLLHFAVNVFQCNVTGNPILLDSVPKSDVTEAIADVLQERNIKADIVILHDSHYEQGSTVKSLLQELTSRGIRYSYLLFDTNVTRLSRRVDMVRRGAKELSAVVLADFAAFKMLLDEMYEQRLLDTAITYLIINDGWESVNPEIDEPQVVPYNVDVHMLLLKRKVSRSFSNTLVDMASKNSHRPSIFHNWKVPYLERENLFVFAAVWSVVDSAYSVWHENHDAAHSNKCPAFEEGASSNRSFTSLVINSMREIGVLADSLVYDLLRNIPVDTEREIFRLIAQWKADGREQNFQYLKAGIEKELLFENRTLKLALPFNPPYTIPANNDTKEVDKGALSKLLDYLSRHLKFNYVVSQPADNKWGVLTEDNQWTGAVQMLLKRNVDLVPFLGITKGRSKVLEFSEPVMTTSTAILVQKPREPPRAKIFLRPFSAEVWYMIIISVPTMAIVLYCVNKSSASFSCEKQLKKKGGLFKVHNCFWYVYGAILQQGGVHLPESISARIVVGTWWLFVVVTLATYTGNLTAFLTFPEADWKVNSIEELVRKESLIVFVQEGTSIHQEIFETEVELLMNLKDRFVNKKNAIIVTNHTSVLAKVGSGEAAFLEDYYVLSDIINKANNGTGTCNFAIVPKTFLEIYIAIATRKGSPYMKDIDILIRSLWHGGLMQYWARRYSKLSDECNFIPTMLRGGRKDVTLRDLIGAFLMLFGGLIVSLIIAFSECLWTVCSKCCKKKKRHTFPFESGQILAHHNKKRSWL